MRRRVRSIRVEKKRKREGQRGDRRIVLEKIWKDDPCRRLHLRWEKPGEEEEETGCRAYC